MVRFKIIGAAAAAGLLAAVAASATAGDIVTREDGKTVVKAPTTKVVVNEDTGATRVKVRADTSRVDVDTERGYVRIRVPYFSGDIRW